MKKLSLGMAAVLALLSIAGCAQYYGKGKAGSCNFLGLLRACGRGMP